MKKIYTVEVVGFDRVSVSKWVAESEAEAIEKAMEKCNIRAKVTGERPYNEIAAVDAGS